MRNVHRVKTGEKKYGLLLSGLVVLWPLLFGEMAIAYQEEEVSGGGSITGVVKFTGIVPSPQTYKVTMGSNPEFCRTLADENGVIAIPQVRVSSKQELADVVIFLQEVERGKSVPKAGPVVTVDRCQFWPYVIGAMADQTLRVAMRDPIAHQLRGWEILDKGRLPLFQIPNLKEGAEATIPLKARRSSIIKLECDQHRFMQGWLLLAANPYVGVTDDHGFYRLTNVPAGTQTVGAWHPLLGYQEAKVKLIAGQQAILELNFVPSTSP